MKLDKLMPEFTNYKTYQVILTDGKTSFISANRIDIDDKGILTVRKDGTIIAEFNFANIAGYRIVE